MPQCQPIESIDNTVNLLFTSKVIEKAKNYHEYF